MRYFVVQDVTDELSVSFFSDLNPTQNQGQGFTISVEQQDNNVRDWFFALLRTPTGLMCADFL